MEQSKQKKVKQKTETLENKKSKNIKAIKFPLILNNTEKNKIDQWMRLGKEFYNILNEQRRKIEEWNRTKYYEANPEKLTEKLQKEKEYQEKIQAEIIAGKRLPKKVYDTPFYSPVQTRHEQLRNINTDVLTHCYGANSYEELMKLDNKEIKLNKQNVPVIHISYVDQSRYGTKLRASCPEFSGMPSVYWLGICQQVDKAFSDFHKNKTKGIYRLPKFKKRDDDFSLIGKAGADNNIKITVDQINGKKNYRVKGLEQKYFPNGLKINRYKPINGNIILTSIVKEGDKYFLNVTFEEQKIHWPAKNKSIGIDLGVVKNVQLSSGEFKQLPIDKIKELEEKKKKMQRKLAKKKLHSNNYKKYNCKINKIDTKIANIRKYYVSMFATEIARDNEIVAIEDLKVKNMTKSAKGNTEDPGKNVAQKSGLNKSILRIAPYMFRTKLEAKGKEYGREIITVDPKYTSQICSACGHKDIENREDQATFICKKCGTELNADLNASINILNRGLEYLNGK